MLPNPFPVVDSTRIIHPKFYKSKMLTGSISNEAYDGIKSFANRYTTGNVSAFLEMLGLYCFRLSTDPVTDEDGTSTEDCRQTGYEDAWQGNTLRFLALYGKTKTPFEDSYIQGYLEGNYIKNRASNI